MLDIRVKFYDEMTYVVLCEKNKSVTKIGFLNSFKHCYFFLKRASKILFRHETCTSVEYLDMFTDECFENFLNIYYFVWFFN